MIPIRTAASNFVYRGPTPDVGDAWTERRRPGEVYITWKPSGEERTAIAAGASIELGIFGREPISPVSLNVSYVEEITTVGVGVRARAADELKVATIDGRPAAGYWLVAQGTWDVLQREHALDPEGHGVPMLLGRPLMVGPELPDGTLEYAVALDQAPS